MDVGCSRRCSFVYRNLKLRVIVLELLVICSGVCACCRFILVGAGLYVRSESARRKGDAKEVDVDDIEVQDSDVDDSMSDTTVQFNLHVEMTA